MRNLVETLGSDIYLHTSESQAEHLFEEWYLAHATKDDNFDRYVQIKDDPFKNNRNIWRIRVLAHYNAEELARELQDVFTAVYDIKP